MLLALKLDHRELSILLCNDETIHALNREYRGYDKPTDVLAFAFQEVAEGIVMPDTPLLGDVIISVDTARRQAKERSWAIVEEVTFLLAHGLLHLLGFDHRNRGEERRMMALTDGLRAAAKST